MLKQKHWRGVDLYEHFQLSRPRDTHWRIATCKEVECKAWLKGWVTVIDPETELGKRQAGYIRYQSGRAFTETPVADLVHFAFPAGQKCFREHRLPLERDPLFIYDAKGTKRLLEGQEWIETFNEKSYKAARR